MTLKNASDGIKTSTENLVGKSFLGMDLLHIFTNYKITDYRVLPWVPFMGFALLHCKNVSTEEHIPNERIARRVKKSGQPPRATFKTLRLELPKLDKHKKPTQEEKEEEDKMRMRLHFCSGHFKNLQNDRYKEKGLYWWPAHWRGDPELGMVVKDYSLSPK
jgi:hypothetical protein